MILDDTEVKERMESPLNLLTRLRTASKPKGNSQIPTIPPTAEEVIEDLNDKLSHSSIKSKAAGIMIAAMDELRTRLPEVQKPERLASIAAEMSKVVHAKNENEKDRTNTPQFVVYAPSFNQENNYETIYARE